MKLKIKGNNISNSTKAIKVELPPSLDHEIDIVDNSIKNCRSDDGVIDINCSAFIRSLGFKKGTPTENIIGLLQEQLNQGRLSTQSFERHQLFNYLSPTADILTISQAIAAIGPHIPGLITFLETTPMLS